MTIDRKSPDRASTTRHIFAPMLASLADAPLTDPDLIYEPKYDGIRAIVEVDGPRIRLWSRLGNEKTAQFPEIVDALRQWARRRTEPLILDGEIVALDRNGEPTGFQQLQGRIHLTAEKMGRPSFSARDREKDSRTLAATAFIAFDVLREGGTDSRDRPLTERRKTLERIFGRARSPILRLSESVRGDGRALYKRALESGWEGLIAKHADSRYKSGKRTPDWRKLKIVHEQEFVIGGWTEPRHTRSFFGALLLGVYESSGRASDQSVRPAAPASLRPTSQSLLYVGHTGTGFNEGELARLMKLLKPLETTECPFRVRPKTNEPPHWVQPTLVAQIKFTEWTADGSLRHPVYLGLRDDKTPRQVVREPVSRVHAGAAVSLKADPAYNPESASRSGPMTSESRVSSSGLSRAEADSGASGSRRTKSAVGAASASRGNSSALLDQLRDLEKSRRDGTIDLPDGDHLSVSNLHKVFWPKLKLTKGDLLRYYVEAAPFILPVIEDRPLTMKRYPNGIEKDPFYQHRAPAQVPADVRVEHVPGEKTVPARFIGGNLKTLLYMTQLASISQDPWFSRVTAPAAADHAALDLDPADGVPFARVLDVARWIRDELEHIGAFGAPKTSGADGLHIYIPLPPGTPYGAGLIFCQIIATVVAQKHPKVATVERSVRARGPRVYVDYLQNIQGKTLATAYSARASQYAGVSTPLSWKEVDQGIRREDFTIQTGPARFRQAGDLWKTLRTSKGVDLSRVSKYTKGQIARKS